MTEFLYESRYGDLKDFDNIKVSSLLDIIQDISTKASEEVGYGLYDLRDRGVAWLLSGITFKLVKNADPRFPVFAQTGIQKMGAATSNRGCILLQNGEVVAKSIANWFLMDMKEGRIARITKEMMASYPYHDFGDEFFNYKKPKFPEFSGVGEAIRVSNRDIDTNRHLNNVKAVEIILDGVPFDYDFDTVDVLYKRESYLGDILIREVIKTDNGYYIALLGEDKEVNVCAFVGRE